ncbi:hypothetical protein [Providencia rettgeri]|uniref:hypothetical protein n=1 Tax=Providencia rettgeri TaxID=587 RepID=UPI000D7E0C04|nr:hypothetical protein [Providencia rettgeri]AWS50758.1 hypothetical protein AM461_08010 [Providencia rettgeri]
MSERKFIFLIRDFIQSMKVPCENFEDNKALVGMYGDIECRIEDGSRVGLSGKLILLIKLDVVSLTPEKALHLNSDFTLLSDCYIALVGDSGYFLIRTYSTPSNVNQLHNYINETVQIARNIMEEI